MDRLERIHAPMGFDIGAITPEEIAVAVVGEMIYRRRNTGPEWSPLSKSIFSEGVPRALEVGAAPEALSAEHATSPAK